jgi:transcriptional regulator with XRE-family HTH domain
MLSLDPAVDVTYDASPANCGLNRVRRRSTVTCQWVNLLPAVESDLRERPIYGQYGRIALVVTESGLSQEAFGKKIGRTRETVNGWVNGRQTTDRESARRIALVAEEVGLGADWRDFFEEPIDPLLELRDAVDELRTALVENDDRRQSSFRAQGLLDRDEWSAEDVQAALFVAEQLQRSGESFLRVAKELRARVPASASARRSRQPQ